MSGDRWSGLPAIPLRGTAGTLTGTADMRGTVLLHTGTPSSDTRRGPRRRMARVLGAVVLPVVVALPATASAATLMQIFESALASDSEFLVAGAANRAAQEIRSQAKAGLLPIASVTLNANANERHRTRVDFESYGIVLNLEQPIYRRDRRIALHQADSRIARADALYAAARQELMMRVSRRYFDVLEAEDELSFARATLEAFEQQLTQSRQRFEVGLTAITDVEEAKAGFDLARAQLIAAENALDTTREALRETSGEYHEALAPLGRMPLVTPEPADIDKWTETALGQNLRLLASRHDAETARREIERVRAGHYPALDAVGSHRRSDRISGNGETASTIVGLRLNLSLYAGGSVLSQTRESRHRYQQALDELERERRRTQRETREAYLGVNSGISQVTALEQAVRSNETAAEAVEAGFQVGTRTSVDVLNAQRELFRARRDFARERYTYIRNVLRLKGAAGTLSEDDLRQVSAWLE